MDHIFNSLENNALYRKRLITMDASGILETCSTKEDVLYLLKMIEAFLEVDNFFCLDEGLMYKLLLLINLIRVRKENQDFFDYASLIMDKVEALIPQLSFFEHQFSFVDSYFSKYRYFELVEMSDEEILRNLSEHYQAIQTIKRLGDPALYYGKSSFLEVLNISVDHYRVHEQSLEVKEYYKDVINLFSKKLWSHEVDPVYKKYFRKTRCFIKHEVR